MQRREFLQKTAAAAVTAPGAVTLSSAAAAPARTFKLKYAPHFGMFKVSGGGDLFDELRFMADAGFRALEDNGMMARSIDVQQRIGDTLAKAGMTMGVFVIDAGDNWKVSLTTGKPEFRERFVKACQEAVDVAKRCRAKWMTVVPGYFDREQRIGVQTGHVIDALRAGADVLAPHGLVMVLEPLSDNPDLFLRTSDQAYTLCRAVNSPACKILYDIYHMQRNEGHLIPNIDAVVGRDRLLSDWGRARPQGARHRRDELPERLQAHSRTHAAIRPRLRVRHGARQLRGGRRRGAQGDRGVRAGGQLLRTAFSDQLSVVGSESDRERELKTETRERRTSRPCLLRRDPVEACPCPHP